MEIRFTVPGEPKGWQRAGSRIVRTKDGRQFVSHYTPSAMRSEQGGIRIIASAAMRGGPPLDCPLVLEATFYLPVPASWSKKKQSDALGGLIFPAGKPDFDNLVKVLTDALNTICYRDDALITRAVIEKRYSTHPRLEVLLRPIGEPQCP